MARKRKGAAGEQAAVIAGDARSKNSNFHFPPAEPAAQTGSIKRFLVSMPPPTEKDGQQENTGDSMQRRQAIIAEAKRRAREKVEVTRAKRAALGEDVEVVETVTTPPTPWLSQRETTLVQRLLQMYSDDPEEFQKTDWKTSTPEGVQSWLPAEGGVGFIHARDETKKTLRWNLICAVFQYCIAHACSVEAVPSHFIAEPIGGPSTAQDPTPSNWILREPRVLKTLNGVEAWSNGVLKNAGTGYVYNISKNERGAGQVRAKLGVKELGKMPYLHVVVLYAYFGTRAPKGSTVDHADQLPENCRLDNLRSGTQRQQRENQTRKTRKNAVWCALTPEFLSQFNFGVRSSTSVTVYGHTSLIFRSD